MDLLDTVKRERPARLAASVVILLLGAVHAGRAHAGGGGDLTEFHREWVWAAIVYQIGEHGFEATDVDGDARDELLFAFHTQPYFSSGAHWALVTFEGGSFEPIWTSLPLEQGLSGVTWVAETDEIAAVTSSSVVVHDAISKRVVREFPTGATAAFAFLIADFDGAAGLDVAICDDSALRVLDYATGATVEIVPGLDCNELAAGQVDLDAPLELALASDTGADLIVDGATRAVEWIDPLGFGADVELLDVDGDGLDEIVSGADDQRVVRATEVGGAPIWSRDVWEMVRLAIADVGGEIGVEIVVRDGGEVRILERETGTERWSIYSGSDYGTGLAVGSADADGAVEIFVTPSGGSPVGVVAIDAETREIEGISPDLLGFETFGIGDVEGNGGSLLVTAPSSTHDYFAGIRPIALDLVEHRTAWLGDELPNQSQHSSGALAAQLDDDPPLEVCIGYEGDGLRDWLRCEDGLSHLAEWELEIVDGGVAKLLAVQLDADPRLELVASVVGPYLFAFEGESGWLKWQSEFVGYRFDAPFRPIRAADFDGDGGLELAAAEVPYWGGGRTTVFDALTGFALAGPYSPDFVSALDAVELDGDAASELVVGTTSGLVAELDVESGLLGPPILELGEHVSAIRSADVTRDGVTDLVVAGAGRLFVLGGAEDEIVWTSPNLGAAGWRDSLYLGNFDRDAAIELLVGNFYGFAMFEAPLVLLFVDGFESGDTGAWSVAVP